MPRPTVRVPTVRDVARVAGVGTTTVSRVLNGTGTVSDTTRERVQAVIRELGFRPNRLANSFRAGSLGLIGMIVPDTAPTLFSVVADRVDVAARNLDIVVTTVSSRRDAVRERALVRSFIGRGADGLLLITQDDDHAYLKDELGHGYPMVFALEPPSGVRAATVTGDDHGGAARAVHHLVKHGHRRIGLVGTRSKPSTSQRVEGFLDTICRLGLDADPTLHRIVDATPAAGAASARALLDLDEPPTAIFSTSYPLTIGVMEAVRPDHHDVALVCYGDFPAAPLVHPGVTVVTTDPDRLAAATADLILRQIEDHRIGGRQPSTPITVPTILIQRGSGELAPTWSG